MVSERVWSQYSEAIFQHYTESQSNLIVEARPGAGKTTNIEHLWSLDTHPTVYVVFNKHNQIEAQEKLPEKGGSAVLTLHGLGYGIVLNSFGRVVVDKYKVPNIIKDMAKFKRLRSSEHREQQYTLAKIVGIAKCMDTGTGFTPQLYENALCMYDDIEEYPELYRDTLDVLERSDAQTNVIDFQDQLRFPVIYDCAMPQYHSVLGDEVQDFNPVQAALIEKLHAQRYALVGDSHQSIYGFRGAMNNSMSVLKEQFHCVELPLSITYRCSKAVVKEAYAVYKDIEAWEHSTEGTVRMSTADKEQYTAQDIVLCRMNRPLVVLAYALLREGIACHVKGRDIGEGLVKLIRKQRCSTVKRLVTVLTQAYAVEYESARLKDDADKMQRIVDKYESALVFCEKVPFENDPEEVCTIIDMVFMQGKGVTLSTVHKAKGLEAERAFILEHALHGSFTQRSKQAWQREQERNILYVAITRAKHDLVYM
jgi:superfamily I DNA/RNA helicase